jgi:hypothetical protein
VIVGSKVRYGLSYYEIYIIVVELFLFHQVLQFVEVSLELSQSQIVGFDIKNIVNRVSSAKERRHVNGTDKSFLKALRHFFCEPH